jgi:hypothetical protein
VTEAALRILVVRAGLSALLPTPERAASVADFLDELRVLRSFRLWCEARQIPFLPESPSVFYRYLSEMTSASVSRSTVERACSIIGRSFVIAGKMCTHDYYAVLRRTSMGLTRTGKSGVGAVPITESIMCDLCPGRQRSDLMHLRDDAILALCFYAGLTAREFPGLCAQNVDLTADAVKIIVIAQTKNGRDCRIRTATDDQPMTTVSMTFPADEYPLLHTAMTAWIKDAAIRTGPLFFEITPASANRSVAVDYIEARRILRRRAAEAGLDSRALNSWSFFKGFVWSRHRAGWDAKRIASFRGVSTERIRGAIKRLLLFKHENRSLGGTGLE